MIKRLFDLLVAVSGLLFLLPVFVVVYLVTLIKMGRPVFFTQERPGLHGQPFQMIKFRTMLNAFDKQGAPLDNSQRLTAYGRALRKTSLDELPELWNVIRGDMSLVGPRPLLMEYLPLYDEVQSRRHEVKPGITGWAQVNGRNAISWEEKFELDVWYVDNQSFWLDLKILFITIKKVFLREGINQDAETTMSKFTGSSS